MYFKQDRQKDFLIMYKISESETIEHKKHDVFIGFKKKRY
jgi:hypothetical protein